MTDRRVTRSTAGRWILSTLACLSAWTTLQAEDAPPPPIPRPDSEHARAYPVVRVIDEGRVSVLVDQQERTVALCGVSAPGKKADRERLRRFLENLLKAEAVLLQYDQPADADSREPRAAYLFRVPDGSFVNLELVRQGYARVREKPAFKHRDLLRHYERRARQAQKGVWAPPAKSDEARTSLEPTSRPAQQIEGIVVYVTKSGKKYHRKDCYHLRKSSQAIALKEAVERGYGPCSQCKPPAPENP